MSCGVSTGTEGSGSGGAEGAGGSGFSAGSGVAGGVVGAEVEGVVDGACGVEGTGCGGAIVGEVGRGGSGTGCVSAGGRSPAGGVTTSVGGTAGGRGWGIKVATPAGVVGAWGSIHWGSINARGGNKGSKVADGARAGSWGLGLSGPSVNTGRLLSESIAVVFTGVNPALSVLSVEGMLRLERHTMKPTATAEMHPREMKRKKRRGTVVVMQSPFFSLHAFMKSHD